MSEYQLPGHIREQSQLYMKYLGPVGLDRFRDWMRDEYRRGHEMGRDAEYRRCVNVLLNEALDCEQDDMPGWAGEIRKLAKKLGGAER